MSNLAALVEQIKAQTPTPPKPEVPASTPSAIASSTDKRTPEEKAADSAKYLKADIPSIGKPTWNYWDGSGRYANITGVDGKQYMFVPDDYVKKGLVQDGIQFYNKEFLDPATFKNSVQYSLPKGMQSVVNNNGYVWSVDDYNKLGLSSPNGYRIGPNDPPILGVGYPQESLGQGNTISYITQPTLAPGLGGQQRVQQDFITAGGGRQVGYGSYSYYQNNDDFSKAFRGALQGLGPLTPILLDIFAGPGTGAIYSMSKAAGEASITGDWNKAATTIGTIMAAPYVADYVGGALGSAVDMGAVANGIVGSAAGNAVVAGLTGGDPLAAFINGGVGGAVGAIMGKIDGFGDLPPSVQRVFNATVRAELSGKDPSKAALLAATTAGLQAIKNGMDANTKFQSTYGRDATPEELNNFAYVQNQDELNQSFDQYMSEVTAKKEAEDRAKTDEANAAKLAAFQKANDEDAAVARAQADAQAKAQAEAQAAIDEQNRIDEEAKNKPVGPLPTDDQVPSEPIGALPTEPTLPVGPLPTDETVPKEPVGALPTEEPIPIPPIDDSEITPKPPIGALPTEDPTNPNPDENPVPEEPPSTLPTEPTLDNELEDPCEPGFHREGDMCVPDDDVPPESTDCPEGYVYDLGSKSCVPVSSTPTTPTTPTKTPTSPLPTTPKTPTTTTTTPTTTPTTQTGGLPTTTTQTGIPWLDTKPQMLETKKAPSVMNPYEPLRQLYDNVDPTLMNVLADRGISPQGYAGGSSVSDVLSQFSSDLNSATPKFAETKTPFLSMGSRKATSTEFGKLPQLKPGLTGHAKGGLPDKYAKAAPKGHNPEFITGLTGFYANGRGTGQSDDIPAMLHDGDYVMDADTVAALGDGSSKAGALSLADFQGQVPHQYKEGGNAVPAKIADGEYVFPEPMVTALGGGDNKKGAQMLDAMREEIRAHKRSAPTSKIPPKAKSPLDYLKMVKG